MPPPGPPFDFPPPPPPPPPGPIIDVGPGGPPPPPRNGGGGGLPPNEGKPPGGANQPQTFSPTYQGWILRKASPEPGQQPDWTRVNLTVFPVSNREMAQRAKAAGSRKSVTAVYDNLRSNNQRAQIDRLVEDQNKQETNPWAQWQLASIEACVRRTPGLFGQDRSVETLQIRVILKRLPRLVAKTPDKKATAKSDNFAGVTVDLLDSPPAAANPPPKNPANQGGMGAPNGPLPPPPHFMPPEPFHDGRMPGPPRRRNSFREPSPGPRSSGAKIDRVINLLDKLAIRQEEAEFDYLDDEDDMERPARRRSKYAVRSSRMGKHGRRRSRSRGRRDSTSSFDMLDELDESSSNGSSSTDATPPMIGETRRYSLHPRSRSRGGGRYLDHKKPPPFAHREPNISYNFFGDGVKDSTPFRRHSTAEAPYGGAYIPPPLPIAPEAPVYSGAYSPFIEPPVRRHTIAEDDVVRREVDAYQRGRAQEQRRVLAEKLADLKQQQREDKIRADDLRRMEDGIRERRIDDALRDRRIDDALRDRRMDDVLRDRRMEDGLRDRRMEDELRDRRMEDGLRDRRRESGIRDRRNSGSFSPTDVRSSFDRFDRSDRFGRSAGFDRYLNDLYG